MVELKTRGEMEAMREAGRVVAQALAAAREHAAVGVTLLELDTVAHQVIREAGATSPFLGYRPHFAMSAFPAVICASVNSAALHGIPDGYRLADGDLLRQARGPRSLTEIATRASVPVETLRKIESGRVPTPAFFTIAALATALDLSLDTLSTVCTPQAAPL